MLDKLQLLAHLSGFTPLLQLFSGVLLQHCTYSLFTNTPCYIHGCQSLLVVGKDIHVQYPHRGMHIHSDSLLASYIGHQYPTHTLLHLHIYIIFSPCMYTVQLRPYNNAELAIPHFLCPLLLHSQPMPSLLQFHPPWQHHGGQCHHTIA